MHHLCDEVLQLIFYELVDPAPLTLVSRRLYAFSQDPYVRAHYFLTNYGPSEAMFQALGRGKVLTEQVIDILLSSGAHFSRYLVQIAMHHYFHTQAHFIRTPWVRNVPFGVFVHFMQKAHAKYGDIPRGKGEDDGSLFMTFLKESRFPPHLKSVTWEKIMEILEKFKFMPLSTKDPIMAQFPLILAIEPRLLPAAIENGFRMDYKYRDFVFRKMFERHTGDAQAEDVAQNIRELAKLDPTMFVSRTVAAEVCMEAKYNDVGYGALKQLDKSGHLAFRLRTLVEDLLKTFLTTRTVSHSGTGDILRQLYSDYPSTDPNVRLVVIIAIFISAENSRMSDQQVHSTLEAAGLAPLTRKDVYSVLTNPFVEKHTSVLAYARREIRFGRPGDEGGMSPTEIRSLVEDVAKRCLEIGCKGKLLARLHDAFPEILDVVANEVKEHYEIKVEDVPSWDGEGATNFTAKLGRDFTRPAPCDVASSPVEEISHNAGACSMEIDEDDEVTGHGENEGEGNCSGRVQGPALMSERSQHEVASHDLGDVSQESLTNMIRQDELAPSRSRRRWFNAHSYPEFGKASYPHDALPVAKWALNQFGTRSKVAATFLTHAIVNDNNQVLAAFLMKMTDSSLASFRVKLQVPVTLKHFQILARLGRAPSYCLYHCIESGAEFYLDEDDYIPKSDPAKDLINVKGAKSDEPSNHVISSPPSSSTQAPPSIRGRKRPRRASTTAVSYAIPDSDDDAISSSPKRATPPRGKGLLEKKSSLQLWIHHLAALQKAELKKFKEHKQRLESDAQSKRARYGKTPFLKSLTPSLRNMRKIELQLRAKESPVTSCAEVYSDENDDDDPEFLLRSSKRHKIVV